MMERHTRLAPSAIVETDTGSRTVDYVFSDESVGRDGHIVKNSAWRLDNFNANPVFLWMHLDTEPPIGRVSNLRVAGGALRGSVRYAETEFADTVYQLVRGNFLSAVSTSWQPLAYSPRPGNRGVTFTDVDLLEISQVPVPALPSALATARSRVNTRPLYEWASRALDTGRYGSAQRDQVEAICRAARPAGKQVYSSAEARARRARELQRRSASDTSEEAALYQKYQVARDVYGLTCDQFADSIRMEPAVLRAKIARALANAPVRRSASVVSIAARSLSEADRAKLRDSSKHLESAISHHSALSGQHDTVGDYIEAAQVAHRRLTSTLKELGEKDRSARTTSTLAELGYGHHKVTRDVKALGEALEVFSSTHELATSSAQDARAAVRQARSGLEGVLGSGGKDED